MRIATAKETSVRSAGGRCGISFPLARKGVTLLELEWK